MENTKKLLALLLSVIMLVSFIGCDLSLPKDDNSSQIDTFSTALDTMSVTFSKTPNETPSAQQISSTVSQSPSGEMVWIPRTGSKFHKNARCSNMKYSTQATKQEAERRGYEPCKNCYCIK